ncbi:hypothetical protein MKW94_000542 [Papaver nudicaule]|uniref:Protein kinase domain-containing protein n=1 Tax=Papaver nudicaule TaxID=74823 RepID=A0AA41VXI8_PAPNU|nr:hypothetical protein [Papaver nudicaule]
MAANWTVLSSPSDILHPKYWHHFSKLAQNANSQNSISQIEAENADVRRTCFESSIRSIQSSKSFPEKFFIDTRYIIEGEELASNALGVIRRGIYVEHHPCDVVIKRLHRSCFTSLAADKQHILVTRLWEETKKFKPLNNPNVVTLYGVVVDYRDSQLELKLISQYMNDMCVRTVFNQQDRNLSVNHKLIIARDAASGLQYLHSKGIGYFNLKLTNVLVNLSDPNVPKAKIGDLGIFNFKMVTNPLEPGGDLRGILPWIAPEELLGSHFGVTEKVDIFSFGIVLWELYTEKVPYAEMDDDTLLDRFKTGKLRPDIPDLCPGNWRKLMKQCWDSNPGVRPSFKEIANTLSSMV